MKKGKLVLLLVVLLAVVGGTVGAVLASQGQAAGRELWEAQDIDSYRFVLSRSCFCLIRGPVVIEVRDGEVVSIIDQATGEPTVDGFELTEIFGEAATIDRLFDLIAASQDAYKLEVTYDETLGYPTEIWIDESELMADEEIGYTVHSLEVLD